MSNKSFTNELFFQVTINLVLYALQTISLFDLLNSRIVWAYYNARLRQYGNFHFL